MTVQELVASIIQQANYLGNIATIHPDVEDEIVAMLRQADSIVDDACSFANDTKDGLE